MRIYDIRKNPIEIACYDTYNTSSNFKMNGAWGIYANYSSGRIIVSDRQNGLFLFDFDRSFFDFSPKVDFLTYPNPIYSTEKETIVRSGNDETANFNVTVYNSLGQLISQNTSGFNSYCMIENPEIPGIYQIKIQYEDYLGEVNIKVLKLLVQ